MELKCEVVQKKSKEGNPYNALRIYLSENPPVTKDVFITDAEIAILSFSQK